MQSITAVSQVLAPTPEPSASGSRGLEITPSPATTVQPLLPDDTPLVPALTAAPAPAAANGGPEANSAGSACHGCSACSIFATGGASVAAAVTLAAILF